MAIYKRERSTRLLVVALVVTSLTTITLDFRGGEHGPLAAMGRVSVEIVSPLQEGMATVLRPIGAFLSNVAAIGSLHAENARLEAELAELRGAQAQLLEMKARNEELTALLELKERLDFETIGATIIGEAPSNWEASMTIDRGTSDGIELDMPVIGPEGLVGRVIRVTDDHADVLLLTDTDSFVHSRLASTREAGVLRGQREQDLRLDLVAEGTPVEPGDVVSTSGVGGVFPPGIPIGVVSQVVPNESTLEEEILVRPYVDFSRLSEVLVVLSGDALEGARE